MALFEDFTLGSVTSSALVGLGLVVAAPVLVPVVGAVIRPVMRLAIKGSLAAYGTAAALVTSAGEEFNQLVADARAELTPVSDAMPLTKRGMAGALVATGQPRSDQ
jgi:hypothetical protein